MKYSILSKILPIFAFCLVPPSVLAQNTAPPRVPEQWQGLYEFRVQKKPLFYFEISSDGTVSKRYPQPVAPMGHLIEENGTWVIQFIDGLQEPDNYFPLIANIVNLFTADEDTTNFLKSMILNGSNTKLNVKLVNLSPNEKPDADQPSVQITVTPESASNKLPEINWKDITIERVPDPIVRQVKKVEAALIGKWAFKESISYLNDKEVSKSNEPDLLGPCKKTIEFCADGTCVIDGKKAYYFADGFNKVFSLRNDVSPSSFTALTQYGASFMPKDILCVRTLPVTEVQPFMVYEYRFQKSK